MAVNGDKIRLAAGRVADADADADEGDDDARGRLAPAAAAAAEVPARVLARLPLRQRVALCARHGLCGLPRPPVAEAERLVGLSGDALRRLEHDALRQLAARAS